MALAPLSQTILLTEDGTVIPVTEQVKIPVAGVLPTPTPTPTPTPNPTPTPTPAPVMSYGLSIYRPGEATPTPTPRVFFSDPFFATPFFSS